MSADNWAICPNCIKKRENEIAKLQANVDVAYGTVDRDTYDRLVHKLVVRMTTTITERTLREDYELGIDDSGTFDITYRAHCDVCRYRFEYSYQQVVPLNMEAR